MRGDVKIDGGRYGGGGVDRVFGVVILAVGLIVGIWIGFVGIIIGGFWIVVSIVGKLFVEYR